VAATGSEIPNVESVAGKRSRIEVLLEFFAIIEYQMLGGVRAAIEPMLNDNRAAFLKTFTDQLDIVGRIDFWPLSLPVIGFASKLVFHRSTHMLSWVVQGANCRGRRRLPTRRR